MKPFIKRLIEERTEFLIKFKKLQVFQDTDKFKSLDQAYQEILKKQELIMRDYLMILNARISYHKAES